MNRTTTFILLTLLCMVALAACSSATPTPAAAPNQSTAATKITKLNLNTASGDEFLAAIPGLGSRMVREFQEYRSYISIQQFRREIGKYVDDAQVAEYEKYVYVPIAINDSDAATLQQIPGLGATESETLMSGRPYASTGDFISRLSTFVSADELEIAKSPNSYIFMDSVTARPSAEAVPV
jgi:DNA uptake protein ComE-like DNA-binding protein